VGDSRIESAALSAAAAPSPVGEAGAVAIENEPSPEFEVAVGTNADARASLCSIKAQSSGVKFRMSSSLVSNISVEPGVIIPA
jgi:hypothetical protein